LSGTVNRQFAATHIRRSGLPIGSYKRLPLPSLKIAASRRPAVYFFQFRFSADLIINCPR
jgi:hypothetical protein